MQATENFGYMRDRFESAGFFFLYVCMCVVCVFVMYSVFYAVKWLKSWWNEMKNYIYGASLDLGASEQSTKWEKSQKLFNPAVTLQYWLAFAFFFFTL